MLGNVLFHGGVSLEVQSWNAVVIMQYVQRQMSIALRSESTLN